MQPADAGRRSATALASQAIGNATRVVQATDRIISADPKKRGKGKSDLVKLCKRYPGTEAVRKAQAILSD